MVASNALVDKIPVFVIGKSLNPRPPCFKGVKNKPRQYRAQKKALINSELFEK